MEQMESLVRLEERVQQAVELIGRLKMEKQRLESETARLLELNRELETRAGSLAREKDELLREGLALREREEEWSRFERDREEIRSRIDSMLAKFEELEI
ncbi:MAG: cell division protein ZapB [Candidatus Latescibacterota bacterium]|nr:MAG: cell division protein ZapB [Candidatus Latescibacterota bacterium]